MLRKRKSRIYLKRNRWYGDFRDYAEVGGKKEALMAPGTRSATSDEAEAARLAAARVEELERLLKNGVCVEPGINLTRLGDFADHHLELEAKLTHNTTAWLHQVENHLDTAVGFFGADALLRDIVTPTVTRYALHLKTLRKWSRRDGGAAKHGTIGPGSQRKYLNSLSKLFRRAIAEGIVPQTHNPVAGMMEKPSADYEEADWLEVPDAALFLHAARLYRPKRADLAISCVYPLIAALLLTGGRLAEVLGLEITDVNFERKTVTFRRKTARRLKTKGSYRVVPLWPQLEMILREYLDSSDAPKGKLLFPSTTGHDERISDIGRIFQELSTRIGRANAVRGKITLHTYCAARLQTIDRGYPISEYTVAEELGHHSMKMVREIYGHLGLIRHRSEGVEYRVDQHAQVLGSRVREVEECSRHRNAFRPNLKNRVAPEVEIAVLEIVREMPDRGSLPVAARLGEEGIEVSGSGVRWIWERHDLNTIEQRLCALRSGRLSAAVNEVRERLAS